MRSMGALAVALGLLAGGCAETSYEPYEGEAWPNRRAPLSVPAGGLGFVTDSRSDTVSLIDLGTGALVGQYPVGRDPVTLDGPHHVAVDAAAGFVYVALSYPVIAGTTGPHASHGSSLLPGYAQKLRLSDMRVVGQVRIDSNPGEIVLSQDGKRLLTSHFDLARALENPTDIEAARATIALIDPATIGVAGASPPTFIPTCIAPHGMALSPPSASKAFVACYGEDVLAVVDLDDPDAEVERVPLGPEAAPFNPSYGPYAVTMSPDGSTLAVGNTVSKDVRFFDVATETFDGDRVLRTAGVPFFAAWSGDGTLLYVPLQAPDGLLLVDLAQDGAELAYRSFDADTCVRPHVAHLEDAATLFLVCEGDGVGLGTVLMLDASTLETQTATEVGVYPDAIARLGGAP